MNLEKFGQFGIMSKWTKFQNFKIEQTSRVESRDRHADGDLKFELVACKNCCDIKIEILILRPNSPASLTDP